MLWMGLVYRSMPPLADWQVRFSAALQHIGQIVTNTLAFVPNWVGALIFLVLLGGLAWYALRQVGVRADSGKEAAEVPGMKEAVETEETQAMQEEPVEYENNV